MAGIEASVRDLVNRDRDCTEQALAQMDLRQSVNRLIGEWKAAGGGDVLPDVRDRVRRPPTRTAVDPMRAIARR